VGRADHAGGLIVFIPTEMAVSHYQAALLLESAIDKVARMILFRRHLPTFKKKDCSVVRIELNVG